MSGIWGRSQRACCVSAHLTPTRHSPTTAPSEMTDGQPRPGPAPPPAYRARRRPRRAPRHVKPRGAAASHGSCGGSGGDRGGLPAAISPVASLSAV
eukprot:366151-Chlamydomonas_euryale.AAC.1